MDEMAWAADCVARTRGAVVTQVEPLTGGAWSCAYGVDTTDERLVLRIGEVDSDFRCDAHAVRFGNERLPVPQVLAIDHDEPGWWCLSTRCEGGFLDDTDGSELTATLDSLFDAMNALRTADLSGTTGHGGWDARGNGGCASWADYLSRSEEENPRQPGWREKMADHPGLTELFRAGLDEIERLLPVAPEARQVIHQDLINRNVRCADGRITGVFDWGCGLYGDHLYDVAWFDFWKPWFPAWAEVDIVGELLRRFEAVGADLDHVEERLHLYRLHMGVGHLRYGAWAESEHLTDTTEATRCELEGRPFVLNRA